MNIPVDIYRFRWRRIRSRVHAFTTRSSYEHFDNNSTERSFELPDPTRPGSIAIVQAWHQRLKDTVVLRVRVQSRSERITREQFIGVLDALQITLGEHFGTLIAFDRSTANVVFGTYPALPGIDRPKPRYRKRPTAAAADPRRR